MMSEIQKPRNTGSTEMSENCQLLGNRSANLCLYCSEQRCLGCQQEGYIKHQTSHCSHLLLVMLLSQSNKEVRQRDSENWSLFLFSLWQLRAQYPSYRSQTVNWKWLCRPANCNKWEGIVPTVSIYNQNLYHCRIFIFLLYEAWFSAQNS